MIRVRPAQIARQIHRWIGAVLGGLLILIALTGIVLIWTPVYLKVAFPDLGEAPRTVPEITQIAIAAETAFGAPHILRADIATTAFSATTVYLHGGQAAYIAPDGTVLDTWTSNGRPEVWLLDLHHRLLSGTAGLWVIGLSGLAASVMVVAGLIAWWPTRRAFARGLILRGTARQKTRDAHRNSGVLLALPLLILMLSGVALSFPQTSRDLIVGWAERQEDYGMTFAEGVDDLEGELEARWPRAIARAAAVFPGAQITGLTWPNHGSEIQIRLRTGSDWADIGTSQVQITAQDGYMDLRIDGADLPMSERAYNALPPIHRSAFGGLLYDLVQTTVGLGLAWLGGLGLWGFFRRN